MTGDFYSIFVAVEKKEKKMKTKKSCLTSPAAKSLIRNFREPQKQICESEPDRAATCQTERGLLVSVCLRRTCSWFIHRDCTIAIGKRASIHLTDGMLIFECPP